jgi:hypothetical protein
MNTRYPQFQSLYRRFADCIDNDQVYVDGIFFDAYTALDREDISDDALLTRAAFFFGEIWLSQGRNKAAAPYLKDFPGSSFAQGNTKLVYASCKHYLHYFPEALRRLRGGKSPGKNRSLARALRILKDSGLVLGITNELAREEVPISSAAFPAVRPLLWPAEMEKLLGLNSLPERERFGHDGFSLVELVVLLVKIILYFGAQRFRNLRKLTLNDIKPFSGGAEVIIREGKNGRIMQRLPLWGLAPPEVNVFLVDVLDYARGLNIPLERNVWGMCGVGGIGVGGMGEGGRGARMAYRRWIKKLGGIEGTHAPRRCTLSWLAVRIHCARHPEVPKEDFLPASVTTAMVFSTSAMAGLKKLIPSDETDALEIIRRIATWTSRHQFFGTYCRAFHYILKAEYMARLRNTAKH